MLDNERVRTLPNYPVGDWTVVLRLAGVGNTPLSMFRAVMLQGLLPTALSSFSCKQSDRKPMQWTSDEGVIYARFDASEAIGNSVVDAGTRVLALGAQAVGLPEYELEVRIADTKSISPDRPLPETFGYMDDVTEYAREISSATEISPVLYEDFRFQADLN